MERNPCLLLENIRLEDGQRQNKSHLFLMEQTEKSA